MINCIPASLNNNKKLHTGCVQLGHYIEMMSAQTLLFFSIEDALLFKMFKHYYMLRKTGANPCNRVGQAMFRCYRCRSSWPETYVRTCARNGVCPNQSQHRPAPPFRSQSRNSTCNTPLGAQRASCLFNISSTEQSLLSTTKKKINKHVPQFDRPSSFPLPLSLTHSTVPL
jgi:hypothetical protein